ncbi:MAG: FmdB family transcriptional regulator [Actinobacteria bacterium]|nr:FmdB family transcriptional regulator [Actinomycetota bacterium]MBU1610011.1 FmdB family transcriptional regulator [Actinomycetota bacterium]MBU2315621.1 FmdB family transcriptional regulator [Actinomycetota bacterium]MBU2384486.1 FmdB family transcriptional regulator [Actinomycetota bacterium]
MPTYSYRCTECSTAFDIQQAFTDDSLTECPTCEGRLRKVFSSIGVTFNGSGFYRTDSRAAERSSSGGGSGSKDSGSKDSGSSGSGSGTKESSSSSTPAKKETASSGSSTSTSTAAAS